MGEENGVKHGFINDEGVYYVAERPISDGDMVIPLRPVGGKFRWDAMTNSWVPERRLVDRSTLPSFPPDQPYYEYQAPPGWHQPQPPSPPQQSGPQPVTPETQFQMSLSQLIVVFIAVSTITGSVYFFNNQVSRLEEKVSELENKTTDITKEMKAFGIQLRDVEDNLMRALRAERAK